nr:hypothetical protein BaRGS_023363 [Batillaria attramentaria]
MAQFTFVFKMALCVSTIFGLVSSNPIPQPGTVQIVSSDPCFNPCSFLTGICGANLKCENRAVCGYVCVPDCAKDSTNPDCAGQGQNVASTKDRLVVQVNPVDGLDFGIFDVSPSGANSGQLYRWCSERHQWIQLI